LGLFLKLCWIFLTGFVVAGDLVSRDTGDSLLKLRWNSQDNSPQGQLEVTARRVDFIITKRGAADTGPDEEMPF
jgi:hypothetical protein